VRVPWSSASFLAYLGGLTILASMLALLSIQSDEHDAPGLVLWAALVLAILAAFAFAARNTGHPVTAGLLAVSAVGAFVIFAGALFDWFGWLPDTHDDQVFLNGFHVGLLAVELLTVVAAALALHDRILLPVPVHH
jgi:hypothetical protein